MHDDDVATIWAKEQTELGAFFAGAAGGIESAELSQAARDFAAVRGEQANGVAGVEVAAHAEDADGEEAAFAAAHGLRSAFVEHNRASRAQGVGDPVFASAQGAAAREEGADVDAVEEIAQDAFACGGRDDCAGARACGFAGGVDFALNAAGTDAFATFADDRDAGVVGELGDSAAARVEHAIDVGEEDESVSANEGDDHGRELVVVAKPNLLCRDGVVFVDDRNRRRFEESSEGFARVVESFAIGKVAVGEEHLRASEPELGEGFIVATHEHTLARSGGSLESTNFFRARAIAEATQAECNGAARDEYHLAIALAQISDFLGHAPHERAVTSQAARANLDDDTAGFFELGTRHGSAWIARRLVFRAFRRAKCVLGQVAEVCLLTRRAAQRSLESAKMWARFASLCGTHEAKGTR